MRVFAIVAALCGVTACGSTTPAGSSSTASTVSTTTASTVRTVTAAKPKPRAHASTEAQRTFERGKTECGFLRYGSHSTEAKAIAAVRSETQAALIAPAVAGCHAAYH